MAYTADIQIAVRGATQITNLQRELESTVNVINRVNRQLSANGLLSNSISNLRSVVNQASQAMRSAAAGTRAQRDAIDIYIKSLDAAERAENELTQAIQRRRREMGLAASTAGRSVGGRGGRFGDVATNAIIGGAFPLLFGQGGGAAAGGAIGGAVGGAFGGAGGFAGSLVGTLIGERAGRAGQIKELAADIGFTAQQTQVLATAFKQAGADFDKFQESVSRIQGLSLSIEDQAKAIQLAASLTEAYGGKIDKVTNAFTNALQTGKVTQATLNQLTSQGIPIQEALAKKYDVSRSQLLQMAKDGKISVQDLIDTLVEVGNKGASSVDTTKSSFDRFKTAVDNLGSAFASLGRSIVTALQPVFTWLTNRITDLINLATRAINSVGDLVTRATQGPQQAARAALQRNELPNLQGVVEIIGEKRVAQLRQQAGPAFMGMGVNTTKLVQLLKQQPEFKNTPTSKLPLTTFNAPAQLPPSAGKSRGKSDAERAAEAAEKERQRVAQVVRERIAESEFLQLNTRLQDDILAAEMMKDSMLAARLKGEERLLTIQYNYAKQLSVEKDIEAQKAIVYEGSAAIAEAQSQTQRELAKIQLEQDQRRLEALQQYIEKQYELNVAIQQQLDLAESVSTTLGQGLTSAFDLLVQGSENWGASLRNIASNILVDLANQLLRIFVIEQAINAIKTFITPFTSATPLGAGGGTVKGIGTLGPNYGIPQYAEGGFIKANQLSIVGERGPELFVPGRSGTIVPNDKMGGSNVQVGSINITVENTGDTLSPQAQKQIAGQVRGIVLATLVDQQRSGGVLR